MTAPTPWPVGQSAPLIVLREETRCPNGGGPAQTPIVVSAGTNPEWRNQATQEIPGGFYEATSGGPVLLFGADGITRWQMARAVALNGKAASALQLPLAFKPGATMPRTSYGLRKYHWELVAHRDALEAGSIFGVGIQSGTGGLGIVPSDLFVNRVSFYFRSLLAENGGKWGIYAKNDFAAVPPVITPTGFTSTVPRVLAIEYQEGINGGTLGMSIDGQSVATFGPASMPVVVAGNVPQWGLSFGNERAIGVGFDYVVAGSSLFTVTGER